MGLASLLNTMKTCPNQFSFYILATVRTWNFRKQEFSNSIKKEVFRNKYWCANDLHRELHRELHRHLQRSTEILSDVNGLEDSIIKMLILPVGSNEIPAKISRFFSLVEIKKLILKLICKWKGPRIAKTIFKKKEVGGFNYWCFIIRQYRMDAR